MEILIFGAVNLILLAVFIGLTLLPFIAAQRLAVKLGILNHRVRLHWLFPATLLLFVLAWAYAGYSTFKQDCSTVPKPEVFSPPFPSPSGFLLYGDMSTPMGYPFSSTAVLEKGIFQYIDIDGRRKCVGLKSNPQLPEFPITFECSQYASTYSKFAVHTLPLKQIKYWWSPPIFSSEIQVEEIGSGKVIAKATDLIFGGGLVGMYLRLFGGDQDFEYLSCGYASANIGPWRPTLSERPRFAEYEAADLDFVSKALGAKK